MSVTRKVIESPLVQGENESITYQLTTTPWGSAPSAVSVKCYEITAGATTDVSADTLSGSASVSGDVISLPELSGLAAGKRYRLEVLFTLGGNLLECYAEIDAER